MNRATKIAIGLTAAVLSCVVAACGVVLALRDWVPGAVGCADATRPTKNPVIDRPARIELMYPKLAPLQSVHWQEHEARARSCPEIGRMHYVMDGLAVLSPERAGSFRTAYGWVDAPPPVIPDDLRQFAPAAPHWQASAVFDAAMSGTFELDMATATLSFTHTS